MTAGDSWSQILNGLNFIIKQISGDIHEQKTTRLQPAGKMLHWGFVLLFAYGIFKQLDNLSQLEDSALFRFEIIFALVFLLKPGVAIFT